MAPAQKPLFLDLQVILSIFCDLLTKVRFTDAGACDLIGEILACPRTSTILGMGFELMPCTARFSLEQIYKLPTQWGTAELEVVKDHDALYRQF